MAPSMVGTGGKAAGLSSAWLTRRLGGIGHITRAGCRKDKKKRPCGMEPYTVRTLNACCYDPDFI